MTDCPHHHTFIDTTGGWHFYGGEVWDDLEDHLICQDCGAHLDGCNQHNTDEYEEDEE